MGETRRVEGGGGRTQSWTWQLQEKKRLEASRGETDHTAFFCTELTAAPPSPSPAPAATAAAAAAPPPMSFNQSESSPEPLAFKQHLHFPSASYITAERSCDFRAPGWAELKGVDVVEMEDNESQETLVQFEDTVGIRIILSLFFIKFLKHLSPWRDHETEKLD